MRFTGRYAGPLALEDVRARASQPSPEWLGADIEPAPGGCWLRFHEPIPMALRVEILPTESGVGVQLVEGALSGVSGQIRLEPADGGTVAEVELELTFPGSVPGTLLRELDQRVFPRWFGSLVGQ